MSPTKSAASHYALLAVEFHSDQPERLVEFYERTLGVTFKATAYPFPRYAAELGQLALVIGPAKGGGRETASPAGTVTLSMFRPEGRAIDDARKYPLYPQRPLGGAFPDRYVSRVKDPDGHHLAFATSLEHVVGRVQSVDAFHKLWPILKEFADARVATSVRRFRSTRDRLLDSWEYRYDRVTVLSGDLRGYTHVVASRDGLFAVNPREYRRVLRGKFYGLTIKDGAIYCFQTCGKSSDNRGRVLKLAMHGGQVSDVSVIVKGLDDGCHQIDFIDDDLFIVDCHHARLLRVRPGRPGLTSYYPLGRMDRAVAGSEFHMNSLARHRDGSIWILLHNSLRKHSEILVLDSRFEVVRRFSVDAGAAHNIVFTNDEHEYLIADSYGGRLITAAGAVVDSGMMMPRGISLDEHTCVVGDSFFTTRRFRRYVPGRVHFFDRASWARMSTLSLPAAPAEVRRIDGRDASLSNCRAFWPVSFDAAVAEGRVMSAVR